eukprot:CAMPEP_0185258256 /NCGR_PEP_ID=MMETSP1359-20130426/7204_1 /TAXON_ID=552665 /ORGANISM="Bigelowiella longifila, Strain CCMP242" /LENGTH=33 /DNA_ID= /DNA_START= /DNA_END= /DNA_ORIENTATION=
MAELEPIVEKAFLPVLRKRHLSGKKRWLPSCGP